MTRTACEVKAGQRIEFANPGDPDPLVGIVNGEPWVYFDGIDAVARIPVYVRSSGECIDVAGGNVLRVGEAVDDLREAFSERV